jgi:glycosyltransferase involved in cell wall biosynthesis
MTNNLPKISIVIPAFNAEHFIVEAIKSVLAQESDWSFEVLVVDDGSHDRTAELVTKLVQSDARLQLIKKENGGPGSARNIGVQKANGEIVLFLDADDCMLPGRLQHQGAFMLSQQDAVVSFGDMIVQGGNRSAIEKWKHLSSTNDEFIEISRPFSRLVAERCYVCNSASAVKRGAYIAVGMQRTDIMVAEDLDFWCRMATAGGRFFLTHKQYTWLRRENHGNLMNSVYKYRDPTMILAEQLRMNKGLLSPEELKLVKAHLDWRANMYFRHLWICGYSNLLFEIDKLADVVSPKIISRWKLVKIFPGWIGRRLQQLKQMVFS